MANSNAEYKKLISTTRNYVLPMTSPEDEYDSLCVHSQYMRNVVDSVVPEDFKIQKAIRHLCHVYDEIRVDVTNWDSYENFLIAVRRLDYRSTPGLPYMFEKPSIGDWLGFTIKDFDRKQLSRLWVDVQSLINDPQSWSTVLWRIFVKTEPHKIKKAVSHRWRLISQAPLHVQVLWQMLFAEMNSLEVEQVFYLPAKNGLSVPYGQWIRHYNSWKNKGLSVSTDMTAWDWTVPSWLIDADLDFRERLIVGDQCCQESWKSMARMCYQDAFYHCKIMLSDGRVFKQNVGGVMKSGCVNTISSNGHMQLLLHYIVCQDVGIPYNEPIVLGDDKVMTRDLVDKMSEFTKYGVIIKSISEDALEFAGCEWRDSGFQPMYLQKHIFSLLHQVDDNLPETLEAYVRFYVHSPYATFFRDVARYLNISVSDSKSLAFWMDNEHAREMKDSLLNKVKFTELVSGILTRVLFKD